jgi:hypothetical protein
MSDSQIETKNNFIRIMNDPLFSDVMSCRDVDDGLKEYLNNMSDEEFKHMREKVLFTVIDMIKNATVLVLEKIKEMKESSIDGKIDILLAQSLNETNNVIFCIEKLDKNTLLNSEELVETRQLLKDIELYSAIDNAIEINNY